ncbi:hypothetical protein TWF132_002810 [Orbilia oligospora]|nr:hypothetical protein TWF751_010740 [Orbilia oligospora]KAF3294893.1 hypothetical protein TWF132_002810 [Orbilia oligospora]
MVLPKIGKWKRPGAGGLANCSTPTLCMSTRQNRNKTVLAVLCACLLSGYRIPGGHYSMTLECTPESRCLQLRKLAMNQGILGDSHSPECECLCEYRETEGKAGCIILEARTKHRKHIP